MKVGAMIRGGAPISRVPQLDILRGAAILLVLGHHTTVDYASCHYLRPLGYFFRWFGWSGVDLFFVLSGFLIGGLLFKEILRNGRLNVRRFILRRALKIWPAYYSLVAFGLITLIYHGKSVRDAFLTICPYLMHIQNYRWTLIGEPWPIIGQTWSLAVEEHFYLALPLVLLICLKFASDRRRVSPAGSIKAIRAVPYIALALGIGCLALRCYRQLWLHDDSNIKFPTEIRMDSLFFGVFLAYVFHFKPGIVARLAPYRVLLIVGGICCLAPVVMNTSEDFEATIAFTLLYLGYGAILMGLMCVKPGAGLLGNLISSRVGRTIGFIGLFSYTIYLCHIDFVSHPLEHFFRTHGSMLNNDASYSLYLLTYVVMALIVGIISSVLVERPMLWVRDQFWPAVPRDRGGAAAACAAKPGACSGRAGTCRLSLSGFVSLAYGSMCMNNPAISVRSMGKSYTIAHNAATHSTLAEMLLHRARRPFDRATRETFWALRDLSFDVQRGEVVGIIGRNGAGKSTLLKILSRITEPTTGEARIYGRVGSLLEVGTGFHPELTGRENIFLNGQILGMRKKEIQRQFDAIVDFSGCERFLDTPVKRYSSGMYVRLAFAVAAHLQSEILVVDEVLAVGDADFQRKCLGKMRDVATGGRTVLFVSHHMQSISTLCQTCIYLESGQLKFSGDVRKGIEHYMNFKPATSQTLSNRRPGSGEVRVTAFETDKNVYMSTDPIELVIRVAPAQVSKARYFVSLEIVNTQGVTVMHMDSRLLGRDFSCSEAREIRYAVASSRLSQGDYFMNVYLCTESGVADRLENMYQIRIAPILPYPACRGDIASHAMVYPEFEIIDEPVADTGAVGSKEGESGGMGGPVAQTPAEVTGRA